MDPVAGALWTADRRGIIAREKQLFESRGALLAFELIQRHGRSPGGPSAAALAKRFTRFQENLLVFGAELLPGCMLELGEHGVETFPKAG